MHRLACIPGLENANSEKDGICGHWLMEFCVSVLRVCIVKFSTTATPLRRRYQSFFSWVPINDSSRMQENGGSFCWDLSIRSPPPSSLVSCEFLFFYNGQNCGVGTTKREWMLAKVVQGSKTTHWYIFKTHTEQQNFVTLSICNQYCRPIQYFSEILQTFI